MIHNEPSPDSFVRLPPTPSGPRLSNYIFLVYIWGIYLYGGEIRPLTRKSARVCDVLRASLILILKKTKRSQNALFNVPWYLKYFSKGIRIDKDGRKILWDWKKIIILVFWLLVRRRRAKREEEQEGALDSNEPMRTGKPPVLEGELISEPKLPPKVTPTITSSQPLPQVQSQSPPPRDHPMVQPKSTPNTSTPSTVSSASGGMK